MSIGAGKGSSPRPVLNRKQFEETFDRINWAKPGEKPRRKGKEKGWAKPPTVVVAPTV